MSRFLLFLILVACVFVAGFESVRAGSDLETWCKTVQQTWDSDTSTCIVTGEDETEISHGLTIDYGESLVNRSQRLSNCCRYSGGVPVTNNGTFLNFGFFVNYGIVDNFGIFDNQANIYFFGTFENNGAFYNTGLIRNHLYNSVALIDNNDTIHNGGSIAGGPGCYIVNNGVINNGASLESCDITNSGLVDNDGTIENTTQNIHNYGTIDNAGIISNGRHDIIYNGGLIDNHDTIVTRGRLFNGGTIDNQATFENEGALYNLCGDSVIKGSITGPGAIIEMNSCNALPLLSR